MPINTASRLSPRMFERMVVRVLNEKYRDVLYSKLIPTLQAPLRIYDTSVGVQKVKHEGGFDHYSGQTEFPVSNTSMQTISAKAAAFVADLAYREYQQEMLEGQGFDLAAGLLRDMLKKQEQFQDKLLLLGDGASSIIQTGLYNNPTLVSSAIADPLDYTVTGLTYDQITLPIRTAFNSILDRTDLTYKPDTVVLPYAYHRVIASHRDPDLYSNESSLEMLRRDLSLQVGRDITIHGDTRLNTATATGKSRMIVYPKQNDVVAYVEGERFKPLNGGYAVKGGLSFGQVWRFSCSETIIMQPDAMQYTDFTI